RVPCWVSRWIKVVWIFSGRRVHLALGSSTATIVRKWHGREWGGNLERVAESIGALRALLAGERGPGGFRLRSAVPGTQIGLAAFGPRMVDVATPLPGRTPP